MSNELLESRGVETMILSHKTKFKNGKETRFPYYVSSGKKKHSLVAGKQWKPGMKIQHATALSSKQYKKFHENTCIRVQDISIKWTPEREVSIVIDNHLYFSGNINNIKSREYFNTMGPLAWNDGFMRIPEFFEFHDNDFEGQIVHWTELKYQ